jgi:SAM-dependent methyltransferase
MERSGLNGKFYESDKERWNEIDKVRKRIAECLQVSSGSRVLDVLVGEGDFARAIAKSSKQTDVIAGEILAADLEEAKHRIEGDRLEGRVELLTMDVTCMPFMKSSFDYVVNFSGWEDFTAVSGEELVDGAFSEIMRVLKKNGVLAIALIPALGPRDEVSKKDKQLEEYLYTSNKRPKFFGERFFVEMFRKHGIKLLRRKVFRTPKSRLRPRDAKEFLEWSCKNYRSFYAIDVGMRSYAEILREFGEFIERHGIREKRSMFTVLIGKNSR